MQLTINDIDHEYDRQIEWLKERVEHLEHDMPKISEQAIAKREGKVLVAADFDLEFIRRTVAPGATDDELQLFLYDCQRRGVHPLDKLLHFTRRKTKNGQYKYTPIVSIDLLRSRAAESGEMAGSDDPVFLPGHGPKPESATVTVYRLVNGQRFPYTATARWSEYVQYSGGGVVAIQWQHMPHVMLGKCAEALALRKGFPIETAGLYVKEEPIEDEDEETPSPAKLRTVTGGNTSYPTPEQKTAEYKKIEMQRSVVTEPEALQPIEDDANVDELPEQPEEPPIGSAEYWHQRTDAQIEESMMKSAQEGWLSLKRAFESLPEDLQDKYRPACERRWKPEARAVEQGKMQ